MPNNQHNEANCDLYGIDLCERAGYDGCHAEKLWQRMNKKEGKRNAFDKLFASHPFSTERANCINHHMKSNYSRTCRH
jgi:predicted Zn-dependent protease